MGLRECSTPFGIKDSCTLDRGRWINSINISAQRLSASKIPALA